MSHAVFRWWTPLVQNMSVFRLLKENLQFGALAIVILAGKVSRPVSIPGGRPVCICPGNHAPSRYQKHVHANPSGGTRIKCTILIIEKAEKYDRKKNRKITSLTERGEHVGSIISVICTRACSLTHYRRTLPMLRTGLEGWRS